MSEETKRDQAASSAARWRNREREARDAASRLADPEAKRKMLFVAESYGLLAERYELRAELLEALEETEREPGGEIGPRDRK